MPLVPGYNFVRAGAARAFVEAHQQEFPGEEIESLSMLGFLRMVQHRTAPKHRCMQVTGFDRLWGVCEDDALLANKIKQLLTARANWVRENLSAVYFVVPPDAEFADGANTLHLRLASGEHVDIGRVFNHPSQPDRDHYHRPFALS